MFVAASWWRLQRAIIDNYKRQRSSRRIPAAIRSR